VLQSSFSLLLLLLSFIFSLSSWGVSKQGYRCTACAMDVHPKCKDKAISDTCSGKKMVGKKTKATAAAAAAAHGHKDTSSSKDGSKSSSSKKSSVSGGVNKLNKANGKLEEKTGIDATGKKDYNSFFSSPLLSSPLFALAYTHSLGFRFLLFLLFSSFFSLPPLIP
jgi:hypothetical protein